MSLPTAPHEKQLAPPAPQQGEAAGQRLSELGLRVGAASAAFSGFSHREAVERIRAGISEPAIGSIDPSKIQLCPQNRSTLDERTCAELVSDFPESRFRVHANTSCGGKFGLHDASSDGAAESFRQWKAMLRQACSLLGAEAYTWHAGRSERATLAQAIARTRDLEQELGIPVGIEGLYPSASTPWLMSSFEDYKTVMLSGAGFALDLSHWQIVAKSEGRAEMGLLREMLAHPRCVEIHLSDNDGRRDNHQKLATRPFWFEALCHAQARGQIVADVFSEGLQGSKRPSSSAASPKLY